MYKIVTTRILFAFLLFIFCVFPIWEAAVCTPAATAAQYRPDTIHFNTCPVGSSTSNTFYLFSKPSDVVHHFQSNPTLQGDILEKSKKTLANASLAIFLALIYSALWLVIGTKLKAVWSAGYTLLWLLQVLPFVAYAWILNSLVGNWDKIVFGFVVCAFPLVGEISSGMTKITIGQREVMQAYKASHWAYLQHLYFPRIMDFVFAGVYLAVPLSMIGVLIGDLSMGDNAGLGVKIFTSVRQSQPQETWIYSMAAILLSLGMLIAVAVIEMIFTKTFKWYAGINKGAQYA